MNEKTFISLKEILQSGLEEETCVNVDHILWFCKAAKTIKLSDGNIRVISEESVEKLESILQPV